jgi:peptide deformylase
MNLIVNDKLALTQVCTPIGIKQGRILGRDMIKFLRNYNKAHALKGVGLAAPQIGVDRQVAVLLFGPTYILINPKIVDASAVKWPHEERCLSFPGQLVKTYRNVWVKVTSDGWAAPKVFGPTASQNHSEVSVMESVAVQHECDHILAQPKLIFDRTIDDSLDQTGISSWQLSQKESVQT